MKGPQCRRKNLLKIFFFHVKYCVFNVSGCWILAYHSLTLVGCRAHVPPLLHAAHPAQSQLCPCSGASISLLPSSDSCCHWCTGTDSCSPQPSQAVLGAAGIQAQVQTLEGGFVAEHVPGLHQQHPQTQSPFKKTNSMNTALIYIHANTKTVISLIGWVSKCNNKLSDIFIA